MPSKPKKAKKKSKSTAAEVDPREEELRETEARLTTLLALLRGHHTPESVQVAMETASARLDDHTPHFVKMGSDTFQGTNHLQGLIHYADALKLRIDMGARHPLKETVKLLERKIELLKDLHGV